ncbi:MAG: hypothetical protein ACLUE8_04610 [Lachnospiraceae bacterium]
MDSLAKGEEEIYRSIPDMVLIDHEQALDFIENAHLALRWMLVSAERSFDAALRAIRLGVFDYLPQPVDEAAMAAALERASQPQWNAAVLFHSAPAGSAGAAQGAAFEYADQYRPVSGSAGRISGG